MLEPILSLGIGNMVAMLPINSGGSLRKDISKVFIQDWFWMWKAAEALVPKSLCGIRNLTMRPKINYGGMIKAMKLSSAIKADWS